ncbi:MAG: hypothetical protein U9O94_11360 [Nanoarchaeota archaeon]|nr:hypothetical protein [Nanoarchaeota archaeon]
MEDMFESKDEDFELDEIRGSHGRKPKMAILNKKKLSSFEMDELFLNE